MVSFRSEFLATLAERGFIHQGTNLEGLDTLMAEKKIAAYIGFDATANSLQAGNLVQIMMLLHLQRTGHKPIVLIGGGTSKVGDPSGKDTARQLLSEEKIASNTASLQKAFSKFLHFEGVENKAILVNNNLWLDNINYLEFLRDYGRHFSVNRMLSFDSVKLRLEREQPLSFLEFNYMILQAYDFLLLSRSHDCLLQMGGSDQWGNIVNGIELTRRIDQREVFGLTTPLLTTHSGVKMGKTAQGAIWLNADQLSPYDYWQFWRNTEDADVARFLALFTLLPVQEINHLSKLKGAELNEAKKILADEATTLTHGQACLEEIHATAATIFNKASHEVNALPNFELAKIRLNEGIPLITLLQETGITTSNSEGRRLIRAQAVKWGEETVTEETFKVTHHNLPHDSTIILSAGKKKHVAIKVADN